MLTSLSLRSINMPLVGTVDCSVWLTVRSILEVIVVRTASKTTFEDKLAKKTRTSGCGVRTVFGDMMAGLEGVTLPAPCACIYRRISLGETKRVQSGQGAVFDWSDDEEVFPNIPLAPDERWIYVATAIRPDAQAEHDGSVSVYATEQAKAPGKDPVAIHR